MQQEPHLARFNSLLDAYIQGTIDPGGAQELLSLLDDPAIGAHFNALVEDQLTAHYYDQEIALGQVHDRLTARLHSVVRERQPARIRPLYQKWLRYAAAAVVIGLVGLGGWLVTRERSGVNTGPVAQTIIKAPATNRASIQLGNGQTIFLDSAVNGQLATISGQVGLSKLGDGQIAYTGSGTQVEYNTVTNPKGSKVIDLAFVDGSHVWLNAGSSITYPVPFEAGARRVQMSGEAYFEVAHDANHPFHVAKGEMDVTVLGTHFNVNAYDDENTIKVTLLEGAVNVRNGGSSGRLQPGQQALVRDKVSVVNGVNLKQVMAWRSGQFSFDNTPIQALMRQVARWYNVEVIYEKQMPEDGFNGMTLRNEDLGEVLKVLELNGGVHFRVEGTRVYVRP